ncbi:MAG: hypothetical protein WC603_03540 [Candidatus Paceibacterota bacterium]|jgi:hypothetical protein
MINNFKKLKRNIFRVLLFGFALVGFIFCGVYVAMQYGWLNVKGSVSERNSYFNMNKMGIKNNNDDIIQNKLNPQISPYPWANTDEWNLMKEVFTRDQEIIKKAGRDAQISPRLILSGVIGEQFRFFGNRRESFKNYFEPLKILASLSNTSFGIAGLKPKTVSIIENNLKDIDSPFYLGPEMEHIVDYKDGVNIEVERMNRITNAKDPYYSYLYVGLYMKEIIAQWEASGYDISKNAGILSTLYNLGFYYSVPKENPLIGGAVININNTEYTFGDLGHEFYYSDELSDIFEIEVQ